MTQKSESNTFLERTVALYNEEKAELDALNAGLLAQHPSAEDFAEDPHINFALGDINGRRKVLEGMAAMLMSEGVSVPPVLEQET